MEIPITAVTPINTPITIMTITQGGNGPSGEKTKSIPCLLLSKSLQKE